MSTAKKMLFLLCVTWKLLFSGGSNWVAWEGIKIWWGSPLGKIFLGGGGWANFRLKGGAPPSHNRENLELCGHVALYIMFFLESGETCLGTYELTEMT